MNTSRKRLSPSARKAEILQHAYDLACEHGYLKVKSREVEARAACSHGLLFTYFHNMAYLRGEIIDKAIAESNTDIIAQGLTVGDAKAQRAPAELKQQARQKILAK